MIGNDTCGQLAALQSHQHSAAGEWIDERSSISDREQSPRRRQLMPAEFLEGDGQPRSSSLRISQRFGRALVLADDFAHYSFGVGATCAHISSRSDETQIAKAVFDAAQSAVTAAIKIDFAGAWRDTSVRKMSFEGHEWRAMKLRSGSLYTPRQRSGSSRCVERHAR